MTALAITGSSGDFIRLISSGDSDPIAIQAAGREFIVLRQNAESEGPAILLTGVPGPRGVPGPPGTVSEGPGIDVVGSEVRLDIDSLPYAL